MQLRIHERMADIDPRDWQRLAGIDYPFLRYEFLRALEDEGCLGETYGWLPRHLMLYEGEQAVAAAPLYLKFNSYGEFVFDWAWADAYQRNGLDYYPKLVSASPYTPATGPKLLLDPQAESPRQLAETLNQAALTLAEQSGVSGLHWLFTTEDEAKSFGDKGYMLRQGCQFHWENRGYAGFDDFLASLSSAKRKSIRRERRRVVEAGIRIRRLRGDQVSEAEWAFFHRLYESTFHRLGGIPTLSLEFFQRIATEMPEGVLLVLAEHEGRNVAAAFNLQGPGGLYGRHWGCLEHYHSLHFEACYYQGLEHAIVQGLQRFEPGAQGEHKVSRGFLPTTTWSAHWIADERFRDAIRRHVALETEGMKDYLAEMHGHSPYKAADQG